MKNAKRKNQIIKQNELLIRGFAYTLLMAPGLFYAYALWFGASLSLCGIFGCTQGFASYNPEEVQKSLLMSGIFSAIAPVLIFFISGLKWWWLVVAAVLLILVPVLGFLYVGADFNGYPS